MAPLITLRNVEVSFPLKEGGAHTVFSNLDLDIEEGEFVCVVGQTGCGKSTLLRLLLGSEHPSSGEVQVDGLPVTTPCRQRGYVPQKYSLFPDKTVLQNVAFGPVAESFSIPRLLLPAWWQKRKSIYADALDYLRRVGLTAKDGGKYPDQLSGGMQQRVAIAQSLILHPRILLMDESFSALDPKTRSDMQGLIRTIWRQSGTTVVFVTHNLAEAIYLGTRVILLSKDESLDSSRVGLDLTIPDHIRRPDGYPRPEELERIMHQLERVSLGDRLEEEMAEYGG